MVDQPVIIHFLSLLSLSERAALLLFESPLIRPVRDKIDAELVNRIGGQVCLSG